MRIIKLDTVTEFPNQSNVDKFFACNLFERKPFGKFHVTKRYKINRGEKLIISYRGQLIYTALSKTNVIDNKDKLISKYPFYFCIDVTTLFPCTGSLKKLENAFFKKKLHDKSITSRGWPIIEDSTGTTSIFNKLRGDQDFNKQYLQHIPYETEKETKAKARIGQEIFRKILLNYWGGCSVTGVTNGNYLVSSHIKPWRSSNNKERLDVYNGLLLIPNLDCLFDKGYISFDYKKGGRIIISSHISSKDIHILGLNKATSLRNIEQDHKKYLNYHQKIIYKS